MRILFIVLFAILQFDVTSQVTTDFYICDKIIKIDSNEYKAKASIGHNFPKTDSYKKEKGLIQIPVKNSFIKFKDTCDEDCIGAVIFNAIGADTLKKWVLIERNDLVTTTYFIVDQKTAKIDTLLGEPIICGDIIVSVQSFQTDNPLWVEILMIKENKIIRLKKCSLGECYFTGVNEIYLFQKTIYFSNGLDYWKALVF